MQNNVKTLSGLHDKNGTIFMPTPKEITRPRTNLKNALGSITNAAFTISFYLFCGMTVLIFFMLLSQDRFPEIFWIWVASFYLLLITKFFTK